MHERVTARGKAVSTTVRHRVTLLSPGLLALEGHDEIYVLVEGEATVTVDGMPIDMEAGDALRLKPEETRLIENGETKSTFVLAGAP
ncbi:cupin domain-containing protein [Natrialbaceae archaeon A-gly3]